MKSVRVKFLKSHYAFGYFAGDNGEIDAEAAARLIKTGHVVPVSTDDSDNDNPLPEDLPARDLLFNAGFTDLKKITEAGESLTDIEGIGKGTLKKITEYLSSPEAE